MTVLTTEQRKVLSDVVVRARELVEAACAQRITALGVAADRAPAVLTEEERAVRVGLRARARQLGSIDSLVTEAGFEHWHRMLFARFLADNHLLVDDKFGQPLTMDDVAEYAAESGETDKWEVAARFAATMLPGIFTQGDPILAMRLPVETRQALDGLLDRLPMEMITAEDSLGWVYQYWQTKRKAEVSSSERKIGGADLAPVTQLFTENYMVRFLLENSLGAWWAARHPDSPLMAEWEYLRRNEDGSPAVGGFDGWPQLVAEVTVMDPCCGSGHFLTAAFEMLWRMRAEEEGLDAAAAQNAVLQDNLYGLELDPRCTQIAMFALALEAWKAGGYRPLPLPNVACCGIPTRAPLADWLDLADGDPLVEAALTRLHALFVNADTLGSLIDPVRAAEQAGLESIDWYQIAPLVQKALGAEAGHANDPAAAVFGHAAAGIARAARYLDQRYVLVATNPPFLGRQFFSPFLQSYCEVTYGDAAQDLSTIFLDRSASLALGSMSLVTPHNWLFLISYKNFRVRALRDWAWPLVAKLGTGAFSAISGEVVKASLGIWHPDGPKSSSSYVLDVSKSAGPKAKARALCSDALVRIAQVAQIANPDSVFSFTALGSGPLLELRAAGLQGLITGDNARFIRKHWEVPVWGETWNAIQTSPNETIEYDGRDEILRWERGSGVLARSPQARIQGSKAWGRKGVAMSRAGSLSATLYTGQIFTDSAAVVLPDEEDLVAPIWQFCKSAEFNTSVRALNDKLIVANATLVKVPFDGTRWAALSDFEYPQGLPEPTSTNPTQWLFRGVTSESCNPLQVATARLLGFCWPDHQADPLDALMDADGIVCLPALGGETTAEERLRTLVATAYGDTWSPQLLETLLVETGAKPGAGLEGWLRDRFFADHCSVFANRPFIWQIWDGRPDGFSALVNYHKLDRKLLERLTYDYLGNWWIGRLNDEVRRQFTGAEARLLAAEELKSKLRLILEGEPPYDIYVRWKSLAEQSLGWEPDLDDGVRLNIRPFMTAGVLRGKPNIKWEKDRGKNLDGTDRLNDLHFTLAERRAARGGAGL